MSYSEFLKYGIPILPKEYALVFDAIPSGVIMLLKNSIASELTSLKLNPADTSVGQICFSTTKRNNNRDIHALFQKDIVSAPNVISYLNSFTPDLNWKKIWCLPSKYLIINNVKEASLKMIYWFYPGKLFLRKYKKDIDVDCSFCRQSEENLCHLLWSCPFSSVFFFFFWARCLYIHVPKHWKWFSLTYINVLFGFFFYAPNKTDQYDIINLVLLLAKYHIHSYS